MEEKKPATDLLLNPIDNTAVWNFREEGDTSGQTYAGTFVFKSFLSPLDTLASGRLYRDLLGPNSQEASEQDRFLAFCMSQLKYRIVKAPPFWNSDPLMQGNIPDINLLSLILDRAISSEVLYKEQLKKRKEEAINKSTEAVKKLQENLSGKEKEE